MMAAGEENEVVSAVGGDGKWQWGGEERGGAAPREGLVGMAGSRVYLLLRGNLLYHFRFLLFDSLRL